MFEKRDKSRKVKKITCSKCKEEILLDKRIETDYICPVCNNYLPFYSLDRIKSLADKNSFIEWDKELSLPYSSDEQEYIDKIKSTQEITNIQDAIITGEVLIEGCKCAIGVMDSSFMMASMGYVVGEKVTRLFERAGKKRLPVVIFCCSGGARMQEGIISLMQMEKTVAALRQHSEKGLLYISVLTNPTMGGVTASFAMIADIVFAEKGAQIGFAGPRVIEQNTGEKLPKGFQTSEFQKERGFVDYIVNRESLKENLARILKLHLNPKSNFLKSKQCVGIKASCISYVYKENILAWDKMKLARHISRPTSLEYIKHIFDEFYEFHGDRLGSEDSAIVAGIARIGQISVTVVAEQKGKSSLEEAQFRNWGMPSPGGYRKALRLMKQAEKFNRPIICFVDTIGAACGKKAEEQGQGVAIANLLDEMSKFSVPILSIIIGEGGSGGALALAIGNEVWMLENSVYSILTPEGYASIVWKDATRAKEAANIMKLSAEELFELGVIDRIIPEVNPVTKNNLPEISILVKQMIYGFLIKYRFRRKKSVIEERRRRFRKY